ncbi:PLP-dependent aminotransferase family protein [Mucilaginibacter sp. X4EP1]|uniref:aminotransferase-like domain-containing protein n=1 Tax=Mucilaginibacter sp. X4EP1 TaxID=2723092 RepID=UPI002169289B|nr:PLP-dependent aminotransferase family protein [Mucilaginibacter sp. X4EP1]MCS3811546.1 GntR family transcriptional regulator/MocR family aminotransferase [Mucilaginibacter sp. X4EP1]
MHPFFSTLNIDKAGAKPVYAQITEGLTIAIKDGILQPLTRLPSSRQLAQLLGVHRKTVIRAYDDLQAQGWLESKTGSGTFVAQYLPVVKPKKFKAEFKLTADPLQVAGFDFDQTAHLEREFIKAGTTYHLDDGFPDPRLAPLHDLSRAYRTQLLMGNAYNRLGYEDPQGSEWLREELAVHLSVTRGMNVTRDNILITRGTVMGLYLANTGLLSKGDRVVVGAPGWTNANANFLQAGVNLLQIPVDEYGINTDELEQLCKKQTVRMVYVTSHHHYPTTVSLRAERRLHLLQLSVKYGFIIFEDDYDYDFHYLNKPLSPLASADEAGMVLYCGSFTKAISPAFRVGYLVGSANVVSSLAKLRRIIDRQGDTMLDNAMAELLQNGIIQRHLRKSVRIYRQRRDVFCNLLQSELNNYLSFHLPEGGMAVWTTFAPFIDLAKLASDARKKDLYFSSGYIHQSPLNQANATRLGFASSNAKELEQCIDILKQLLDR